MKKAQDTDKMIDRVQFDCIYSLLEGIERAAKDGDLESCRRHAQGCRAIMTDLTIEASPRSTR